MTPVFFDAKPIICITFPDKRREGLAADRILMLLLMME
jgi:hypothetical protein